MLVNNDTKLHPYLTDSLGEVKYNNWQTFTNLLLVINYLLCVFSYICIRV